MNETDQRGEWPFLARAAELRVLTAAVVPERGADDAPGGGVVVAPAGVGKTRLVHEVRRAAAARGVPTAVAIATRAARSTPYGALAHLVADTPAAHDDLSSWYRTVAAALRPDGFPTLLVVDDAHLLDERSAALLLHLALTGAATVLATVRRGEPVPDPVTALWKDGPALRIDLQALSPTEVGRLIEAGLGGEVARETRERLAELSGGNVLFARELVYAARGAGTLAQIDGVWRWDGSVVLAPRLVDAVGERLATLDDPEREALAVVALGEPLASALALDLVGELTLGRLEAAGLVALAGNRPEERQCRLAHPLYGDVVLAGLGRIAQARLTLRLADALAGSDEAEDLVRVATWRLDVGGDVGPDQLLRAATLANRLFDPGLAARLARAARTRGAPARAVLEIAAADVARNRYDEAEQVLAGAEEEILASDDLDAHQLYLDRRHDALYMGLRRRDDAVAMLDRFEAAHAGSDPEHREHARQLAAGYRAEVLIDEGRVHAVLALVGPTLEAGDGARPLARMRALSVAGEALAYLGRTREARRMHRPLRELGASGRPEVRRAYSWAVLQECMCLTYEGHLDEAAPIAQGIHAAMANEPEPHVRGLVALVLGAIELQRGRVRTAHRVMLDAVDGFRHRDSGQALSWSFALLAQAEAMLGRLDDARASLRHSEELRPGGRPSPRMLVDLSLSRALVQVADGDTTGAIRTLLGGAEGLGELALPRARLLHVAAGLGARPAPLAAEIRALTPDAECDLPALLVEHLEALADDDGDRLAEVAGRFEAPGQLIQAAEAAAEAARAFQRAGRRGDATREAARSRAFAARCEGAQTWAMRLDLAAPRLSRREAEVARLAARGLSNAEIAERLVLSVRTVESHLYQAFAKLGVDHRGGLDAALGAAAPDAGAGPPSR